MQRVILLIGCSILSLTLTLHLGISGESSDELRTAGNPIGQRGTDLQSRKTLNLADASGYELAQTKKIDTSAVQPRANTSMHQFTGTSSCAASNYHGGDGIRGVHGSEYSLWAQEDPHAGAYTVLFNDLSQRIAKQLKLTPMDGKSSEEHTPAHHARECLACHSTNSNPRSGADGFFLAEEDGVGCESCHGAASNWLGPHVRFDWKRKSDDEKQQLGFRDTKNLVARGRACVTCHVGSPGREVNHDLIAAGHPRLFFEFSAFHTNMPAHWDRDKERRSSALDPMQPEKSYFEAKLWMVGQVVSAEAAMLLIESHTERDSTRWPELADFNCFACHHDLTSPSPRQDRTAGQLKRGRLRANRWYISELGNRTLDNHTSIFPLQQQRVYESAVGIRFYLEIEWIGKFNRADAAEELYSSETIRSHLRSLVKNPQEKLQQDWDSATQWYLALVALNQGLRDSERGIHATPNENDEQISKALTAIRKVLEYPTGYNSPKSNRHLIHNADIQQHLKTIQDKLGR